MSASLFRLAGIVLVSLLLAMPAYADDHDDDQHHDHDDDSGFGAYIYEGTVDDYGERPVEDVGELEPLRAGDDDLDDVWDVIGGGDPVPDPLYGEDDEDIDLSIEQLTAAPHVLVVHAEEDRSSPVIAIGAIDGDTEADGSLLIDLDEVDGSGHEGRAHFAPDDDDHDDDDHDDLTDVTIGVWEVQAAGA